MSKPPPLCTTCLYVTLQGLSDQSRAGVYRGKRRIPPILGHFGPIRIPYPKGLDC